jgi:hypothetical protein
MGIMILLFEGYKHTLKTATTHALQKELYTTAAPWDINSSIP